MGSIHKFSECFNIVFLQSLDGCDCTLILVNRMFASLSGNFILNGSLVLLKLLIRQISKCFDIHNGLQILQCLCTLISAVIVCGSNQAVFNHTVGDNNFCPVKYDRCIFKRKIRSIKENCIVLFAHGRCKLIHNSTVAAIVIVFGILSDQCQILIGHIETIQIL